VGERLGLAYGLDVGQIKVKTFAVLLDASGTRHLVWRGIDSTRTPDHFHRLLGGHLEFGESTVAGVEREIEEELGTRLLEPRLLGVLESRFVHEGEPGHEIVFVYAGRLADPEVVGPGGAWVTDSGVPIWVEWRPVEDAGLDVPLYPGGLRELIEGLTR
jgi:ADP-ribose pyrophosphatase YjhB (NUDIX family)